MCEFNCEKTPNLIFLIRKTYFQFSTQWKCALMATRTKHSYKERVDGKTSHLPERRHDYNSGKSSCWCRWNMDDFDFPSVTCLCVAPAQMGGVSHPAPWNFRDFTNKQMEKQVFEHFRCDVTEERIDRESVTSRD
jgi:hypothetical protein